VGHQYLGFIGRIFPTESGLRWVRRGSQSGALWAYVRDRPPRHRRSIWAGAGHPFSFDLLCCRWWWPIRPI